jgi:hypothetical protein
VCPFSYISESLDMPFGEISLQKLVGEVRQVEM